MISKYLFLLSLFLFVVSALLLLLNHAGFALRLLTYTFFMTISGTFFYLWELKS